MLRGDAAARATYYRELFGVGVLNQNDIRRLEDLDPMPDGDNHYVPANMVPIEMLSDFWQGKLAQNQQTKQPKPEDKDTESDTVRQIARSFLDPLGNAIQSWLNIEYKRVTRGITEIENCDQFVRDYYRDNWDKLRRLYNEHLGLCARCVYAGIGREWTQIMDVWVDGLAERCANQHVAESIEHTNPSNDLMMTWCASNNKNGIGDRAQQLAERAILKHIVNYVLNIGDTNNE